MNTRVRTFSELKKPQIALDTLSKALQEGYLTLFIGAGVSKSASENFPDWYKLVHECCTRLSVTLDQKKKSNNKYLREKMEIVENRCKEQGHKYSIIVRESLYKDVNYDLSIMKSDILIALGSLIMGSVRGSIKNVFTYNYDDLLEWYLEFHGFMTQIVTKFPQLIKRSDVNIYHPHGFLPREKKFLSFENTDVILSQHSYLKSYKEVESWNEYQVATLSCTLGLFIGKRSTNPFFFYPSPHALLC
jgi:hypothetical protein